MEKEKICKKCNQYPINCECKYPSVIEREVKESEFYKKLLEEGSLLNKYFNHNSTRKQKKDIISELKRRLRLSKKVNKL